MPRLIFLGPCTGYAVLLGRAVLLRTADPAEARHLLTVLTTPINRSTTP